MTTPTTPPEGQPWEQGSYPPYSPGSAPIPPRDPAPGAPQYLGSGYEDGGTGPIRGVQRPAQHKHRRIWPYILGAVLLLLVCGGLIAALAAAGGDKKEDPQPFKPTLSAEAASPRAAAKPGAPTIDEGVWTVGADVKAGTYKTNQPVEGGCYWQVDAANGNVIDNGFVKGGRPEVKLTAGQKFTTNGCGTWTKIK